MGYSGDFHFRSIAGSVPDACALQMSGLEFRGLDTADHISLAMGVVSSLLQLQARFGPETLQSGQEDVLEVIDSWRPMHISSPVNR